MQYRVWLVETPGEKFTESEVPIRSLQPNEVLVRIEASGVNPLDTKIRAGKATHAKQPLPASLGLDMAGTVEEVGSGDAAGRVAHPYAAFEVMAAGSDGEKARVAVAHLNRKCP
jgi:NADPH:quinone reductase-like Zn-dependent oxidoreductase